MSVCSFTNVCEVPYLIYQHSHGDAGHVEPVQEVLDGHVCLFVHSVGLLQLQHPLSHSLNHISMAGLHSFQGLAKVCQGCLVCGTARVKLHQVSEALSIPGLQLC